MKVESVQFGLSFKAARVLSHLPLIGITTYFPRAAQVVPGLPNLRTNPQFPGLVGNESMITRYHATSRLTRRDGFITLIQGCLTIILSIS